MSSKSHGRAMDDDPGETPHTRITMPVGPSSTVTSAMLRAGNTLTLSQALSPISGETFYQSPASQSSSSDDVLEITVIENESKSKIVKVTFVDQDVFAAPSPTRSVRKKLNQGFIEDSKSSTSKFALRDKSVKSNTPMWGNHTQFMEMNKAQSANYKIPDYFKEKKVVPIPPAPKVRKPRAEPEYRKPRLKRPSTFATNRFYKHLEVHFAKKRC